MKGKLATSFIVIDFFYAKEKWFSGNCNEY